MKVGWVLLPTRTASLGQQQWPAGEFSRLRLWRECRWGRRFADEMVLPGPGRLPWLICSACLEAGPEVCWSPWTCGGYTPEGMCFATPPGPDPVGLSCLSMVPLLVGPNHESMEDDGPLIW